MNGNTVIQNINTTKNIINRINNKKRVICLLDKYDNSEIAIDDELLEIIDNYYKNKLRW